MMRDLIRNLQKASVRPNDFTSRYSQLLERLWQRKDSQNNNNNNNSSSSSTSTNNTTNIRREEAAVEAAATIPDPSSFRATPLYTTPDEFSWLDLQAVGELVSGDHDSVGFGGLDGYTQFMNLTGGGGEWGGGSLGLMEGENINYFF